MSETRDEAELTGFAGAPERTPESVAAAAEERILLLECRLEQRQSQLESARADADLARTMLAESAAREADLARRYAEARRELAEARAEIAALHRRLEHSEALRAELEGQLFESSAREDAEELIRLRRELLVERHRADAAESAADRLRERVEELRASRDSILARVAEWHELVRRDGPDAVDLSRYLAELRGEILELESRFTVAERREATYRQRLARAGIDPDSGEVVAPPRQIAEQPPVAAAVPSPPVTTDEDPTVAADGVLTPSGEQELAAIAGEQPPAGPKPAVAEEAIPDDETAAKSGESPEAESEAPVLDPADADLDTELVDEAERTYDVARPDDVAELAPDEAEPVDDAAGLADDAAHADGAEPGTPFVSGEVVTTDVAVAARESDPSVDDAGDAASEQVVEGATAAVDLSEATTSDDPAPAPPPHALDALMAAIERADVVAMRPELRRCVRVCGEAVVLEAIRRWTAPSERPLVRAAAYEAIGLLLARDPGSLEPIVRVGLRDTDPRVRRRVVLAAAAARGLPLDALLEDVRDDPDPQVRRVVREILRHALSGAGATRRPTAGVAEPFTYAGPIG